MTRLLSEASGDKREEKTPCQETLSLTALLSINMSSSVTLNLINRNNLWSLWGRTAQYERERLHLILLKFFAMFVLPIFLQVKHVYLQVSAINRNGVTCDKWDMRESVLWTILPVGLRQLTGCLFQPNPFLFTLWIIWLLGTAALVVLRPRKIHAGGYPPCGAWKIEEKPLIACKCIFCVLVC